MKNIYLSIIILCLFLPSISADPKVSQAVELGLVSWGRSLDKAYKDSKVKNKPILLLFQEVPGCHGVQEFGKEVLSNDKIVAFIENNFIPIFVYNNKGGKDEEILRKFNEPSWNYQVVRFLDSNGKDIIPRKDGVNTRAELTSRMKKALSIYNKRTASTSHSEDEILFAQSCFWTGEASLGGIEGVTTTEAGFFDGREVTKVKYNKEIISKKELVEKAKKMNVADKVYPKGSFRNGYRKAPKSDQKRQLSGTKYENMNLTDYEATKINSAVRSSPSKLKQYLKSFNIDNEKSE